jgi:hypothetical protein
MAKAPILTRLNQALARINGSNVQVITLIPRSSAQAR